MQRFFGVFLVCLSMIAGDIYARTAPPEQVGEASGGRVILPTRQIIRAAGQAVGINGRPIDLVLSPDGKTLYVKDNRGVVVLDTAAWKVTQELSLDGGTSLHGIAVSRDGSRVYVTNAQSELVEAQVGADGKLSWLRRMTLPGTGGKGASYPCGLALLPDGKRAVVCLSRNNTLGVVDLEAGKLTQEIPVGVAPFDVALTADDKTAFVSDWGGRRPKSGEKTAPSAGTETLIDARGIANSGCVSILDLEQSAEIAQIETGLHPSDLELSADGQRLYVANANSDTVSVIDTVARNVAETLSVRPDPTLPFGSMPNALALSPDGKMLYVANGGNNTLAIIALGDGKETKSRITGLIPTGWYPGGVVTDSTNLYIANIKGLGSRYKSFALTRPKREKSDKKQPAEAKEATGPGVYDFLGTVNRIPFPTEAEGKTYAAQVLADARIPEVLRTQERAATDKRPVPVPEHVGEPSVFEHVVYVIKENRTYDQLFGDMKQGNSDPKLCVFGREVTPNHHALAEQFVLLDNFYCNGVLSADGHSWATEGNVTDHLEKAFGGFTRSYTFGDDPLTYSSSGFLWDNALAHGLSIRNYGEMDYAEPQPAADFFAVYRDYTAKTNKIAFSQNIGVENLRHYSSRDYPGWNLNIPDVLRADRFLKELKEFEEKGTWPNLIIVYLPQDHTSGTSPNSPTPRAQVADNDLALGRVIEGISKSKFWPKTCIFVVEDDPQDGFDHVDGHRSPCLVVSPYTKRGKVVHNFYNQTSVLHTMQRMLGLSALNQMDAAAPLMRDCFTEKPDLRPYGSIPNRIPLDEKNPPLKALRGKARQWAQKSLALRLDGPDRVDDRTFNRILWASVKGNKSYPGRLEGAHGRGLKALGLRLSGKVEADAD